MKSKKKLLWVSYLAPYDTVPHAGGKTHNFYVKGIQKIGDFDIHLITFAKTSELAKIDLSDYGIDYDLITHHYRGISHLFWASLKKLQFFNILDPNGGFVAPYVAYQLKKHLRKLKKSGYIPDIIILEWTQIGLYEKYIRRLFPNIPTLIIEVDVSFLSLWRKYEAENRILIKYLKKSAFNRLRSRELECLIDADTVIVNNRKDLILLQENGIFENVIELPPYFQSFLNCKYTGRLKDIVFYGAMSRPENWRSAIWFIENVWPMLDTSELRFVIVGSNPPAELLKYSSDHIILTGFVEDISPYFQNSLCFVAPLVLGAGIKVKIIEAMSAGIPVLTNHIGIEGINAVNGEHYFHCEKPQEYVDIIQKLISGEINKEKVSNAAKEFIKEEYHYDKSLLELNRKLIDLCEEG